jgi:hypothetical protein
VMKRSSELEDPTMHEKEEVEKDKIEPRTINRSSSLTEEERYNRRILANRNSARNSYLRRRKMIEDLYSTVDSLTKERDEFERECKRLRSEVSQLKDELLLVRKRLHIHQQVQPGGNSLSLLNNPSILSLYQSSPLPLQQLEIINSMNLPSQQNHNVTLSQSQSGLMLPTSTTGCFNMQATNDAFRMSQLMYQQQLQLLDANMAYNNMTAPNRSAIASLGIPGDSHNTIGYNRELASAFLHDNFSRNQLDPDEDITNLL